MRLAGQCIVLSSLLLLAAFAPGQAKPPAKAGGQMPGGSGKIGTPYKLGPKDQELHFTLEKVEFLTRFMIDSDTILADPDHRLLAITFAVQNPGKTDRNFGEREFKFTVVSPDDENYVVTAPVVQPDRRTPINMMLKPVQKVRAIAYLPIHPKGPVNKLIVQRGDKTPVLRYDLHDLVKPLASPFAADEGKSSINPGVVAMKVPFELGPFDFTIDSMEELPKVGDYDPGEGKKVVVFHMVLNAVSMVKWWSTGNMQPKLIDEDGSEINPAALLKNSSDENFFTNPEAGATLKFRVLFYAGQAKLLKLVLFDSTGGRSVVLPLAVPGS